MRESIFNREGVLQETVIIKGVLLNYTDKEAAVKRYDDEGEEIVTISSVLKQKQ